MNEEQVRAKIKYLFKQLENAMVDATPEQKEAFRKIKGIVKISEDFAANLNVNTHFAVKRLDSDIENLFIPSFPKGGITQGETHQGEFVIPKSKLPKA